MPTYSVTLTYDRRGRRGRSRATTVIRAGRSTLPAVLKGRLARLRGLPSGGEGGTAEGLRPGERSGEIACLSSMAAFGTVTRGAASTRCPRPTPSRSSTPCKVRGKTRVSSGLLPLLRRRRPQVVHTRGCETGFWVILIGKVYPARWLSSVGVPSGRTSTPSRVRGETPGLAGVFGPRSRALSGTSRQTVSHRCSLYLASVAIRNRLIMRGRHEGHPAGSQRGQAPRLPD